MRHLLSEHRSTPLRLPNEVVDTLHSDYSKQLEVRYGGETGVWDVLPNSYVGTIHVLEHEFLIQPKVPLANLLSLMDVEIASEHWRQDVVGLANDPDLLSVMARIFCIACESATRRGVRRSYVTQEELLVSPRGRIDIAALTRNPGTLSPVPCRFDEHTSNNQLNQLLRAALGRARRVPALGAAWQRRLLIQLSLLEDVDDVSSDWSWVDRWEPSPMELHYSTAVRLGRMLLLGSSVRSTFGATAANAFLLDMNYLFESWVGRRLVDHFSDHSVAEQDTLPLDIDSQVQMRPDIIIRDGAGSVVVVADCKYKLLEKGDGRNSDYYQALAYATALGLDEAWLIYASEPGEQQSKDVTVRNADTALRTFGVDLSGDISSAVSQLHEFAARSIKSDVYAG